MERQILEKLNLKIKETFDSAEELKQLINNINLDYDKKTLLVGILIGRLYNSFYYQSRRILNRNPTDDEFIDFVKFVNSQKPRLLENIEAIF